MRCWFVVVLAVVLVVLPWLFVRGTWFFHCGFVVVVETYHRIDRDSFLFSSVVFVLAFLGFSDHSGPVFLGGDPTDLCFVESLFEWS